MKSASVAILIVGTYRAVAFSPQTGTTTNSIGKRTSELYTGGSVALELPSEAGASASSFNDRMRGMLGDETSTRATAQRRILPSNLQTVTTLKEYKEVVGDESSQMVAVRFYAPWCRACKAAQPYYYKMANEFPNVMFVDVPVTPDNKDLYKGLGIRTLPYGHIYHPTEGLVEESSLIKKRVSPMAQKLQSYVQGSCQLSSIGDTTNPYLPQSPFKKARNTDGTL